METHNRFRLLLSYEKQGVITDNERNELEQLLREHPEWQAAREKVKRQDNLSQILSHFAERSKSPTPSFTLSRPRRRHFTAMRITAYAAAVLLPLILALSYIFFSRQSFLSSEEEVNPVALKATLQTQGGEQLLSIPASSTYASAQLPAVAIQPGSNTPYVLSTNRGHEFRVTLEDGTIIHLNYDSELHFPQHFGKQKRQIYLVGEAYIKVAKDRRSFIIKTPAGQVKQYGTIFNVKADRIGYTEVVLVEGRVGVTPFGATEEKEICLRIGQKASFSYDNDTVAVVEVDTTPYVAWDEGQINFEEKPLSLIMDVVARWYGVKVKYASIEMENVTFTGNLDRNSSSLSGLLQAISEVTGLKVELQDKTILISSDI